MLYQIVMWLWIPLALLSVFACIRYGFLWGKLRWFLTGSVMTFALSIPAEKLLPMLEYDVFIILLVNMAILFMIFRWRKMQVRWQEWVIMLLLSLPLYVLFALAWIDSAHYLGIRV